MGIGCPLHSHPPPKRSSSLPQTVKTILQKEKRKKKIVKNYFDILDSLLCGFSSVSHTGQRVGRFFIQTHLRSSWFDWFSALWLKGCWSAAAVTLTQSSHKVTLQQSLSMLEQTNPAPQTLCLYATTLFSQLCCIDKCNCCLVYVHRQKRFHTSKAKPFLLYMNDISRRQDCSVMK